MGPVNLQLRRYEVVLVHSYATVLWSGQTWSVLGRYWTVRGARTHARELGKVYGTLSGMAERVAGGPIGLTFRVEVRGPVPWRS